MSIGIQASLAADQAVPQLFTVADQQCTITQYVPRQHDRVSLHVGAKATTRAQGGGPSVRWPSQERVRAAHRGVVVCWGPI